MDDTPQGCRLHRVNRIRALLPSVCCVIAYLTRFPEAQSCTSPNVWACFLEDYRYLL